MEDLSKINASTLYLLLKNLVLGLTLMCVALVGAKMLPVWLSPVVSIACIGYLYFQIVKVRVQRTETCMIATYAFFACLLSFTVVLVLGNILFAVIPEADLPPELVFFSDPFIPSLVLMPISAVVCLWLLLRHRYSSVCRNCVMDHGLTIERGRLGIILSYESRFQLRNLTMLFFALSVVVWLYYIFVYIDVNQNNRDWYVFLWLVVIGIFSDEIYFVFRYYNLYLDLKERGQIVTLGDLQLSSHRTYLRIYLICDNYVYVTDHASSKIYNSKSVIDTPFVMHIDHKPEVNNREVENLFEKTSGISGGELRMFYHRVYSDYMNQNMNRYFYFLDGEPEDYPQLCKEGMRWIQVKDIRATFDKNPKSFKRLFLADITRLSTIMITSKSYYEDGERRSKLHNYRPTFTFSEIRNSDIDFNDDKWIRLSTDNSDSAKWRLSRLIDRLLHRSKSHSNVWL